MAGKLIRGITIEIGGNTTKLDKALESPEKRARSLEAELKKVDKALKLDPKNTELLAQKQKLLAEAVKETKTKLDTLKEAEKQVQEQVQKGEVSEDQYRELQREISNTEQKLKSLENEASSCNSSLGKAAAATKKIGDSATALGKKIMPVSAGVAAVGTAATAAAINYETAFAGVKKTTDELLDANGAVIISYDDLSEGIRGMSQRMPQSAAEIAGVAEAAGQLGVATEDLLDFTETMVMLGDSTNLSSEQAAMSIAKFTNITGLSQKEVGRLGSALVDLGNNSATTEADILNMATQLASAGSQVGMTDAEILGLSAALSSLGLEAHAGGSAFSKVMKQMQVDVETGSGNIENFAAVAGMSVEEFSTMFRENATGALNAFILGLGDTESMGMSTIAVLDEMGITELRMSDALMRTSGASDLLTNSLSISQSAWESNSALQDEASKRYGTTASQLSMLKNAAVEVGIQIGEFLVPFVQSLVEKIKGAVEWFSNLDDGQKKTIITIAGIVAALGPALIIFGKVMTTVSGIITVVSKVGPVIKTVQTAFSAFGASLMANPVFLIIGIIVGVIAALVLLYNNCEWFRNAVDAVWGGIKTVFFAVWDAIKAFFTEILPGVLEGVAGFFKGLWDGIVSIFSGIGNWFQERFTQAAENSKAAWNAIGGFFSKVWDGIQNVFSGIGNWFQERFIQAAQNAQNAWSAVGGFFSGVWDGIKSVFGAVGSFFANAFSNAWSNITNAFSNVGGFFSNLWNTIVARFTDIGVAIGSAVGGAFKAGVNGVLSTVENVVNGFIGMINGVIGFINKIPGVNLGSINPVYLPRLAKGGTLRSGMAMVAEAGPELIRNINGETVVVPLTDSARNAAVDSAGGQGGVSQTIQFYDCDITDATENARRVRNETRNLLLAARGY